MLEPNCRKQELFIVEGKSAGAALKRCTDKALQSVHALQGKLLNVRKHPVRAILANLECQKLIATLDCGFAETLNIEKLAYSEVLILMDPDIDGAHSSALVLSFFASFYLPLITARRLSIIKPPMFRVGYQSLAPSYAWSQTELEKILAAGDVNDIPMITRFKGIAQFSTEECDFHFLNPNSRRQSLLCDTTTDLVASK